MNIGTIKSFQKERKRNPESPVLRGQSASNSSKNITQGEEEAALWKTCRTALSLSPTYCIGKCQKENLKNLNENKGPCSKAQAL